MPLMSPIKEEFAEPKILKGKYLSYSCEITTDLKVTVPN